MPKYGLQNSSSFFSLIRHNIAYIDDTIKVCALWQKRELLKNTTEFWTQNYWDYTFT